MIDNGTYELVPHHTYGNFIGNKWVFKTKLKANRFLDIYKSRVIEKMFSTNSRHWLHWDIISNGEAYNHMCCLDPNLIQRLVGASTWC